MADAQHPVAIANEEYAYPENARAPWHYDERLLPDPFYGLANLMFEGLEMLERAEKHYRLGQWNEANTASNIAQAHFQAAQVYATRINQPNG